MKKEECRVGMLVSIVPDETKAVIVKLNPKRARVRLLEKMRGARSGSLWNMPYHLMLPLVDKSCRAMVAMKSFEQPDNEGIKKYMEQAKESDEPVGDLELHDHHIMSAIKEIYRIIDDTQGKKRYDLSRKINLLFAALGREISMEAAENWRNES
jgi:hypothetical protein